MHQNRTYLEALLLLLLLLLLLQAALGVATRVVAVVRMRPGGRQPQRLLLLLLLLLPGPRQGAQHLLRARLRHAQVAQRVRRPLVERRGGGRGGAARARDAAQQLLHRAGRDEGVLVGLKVAGGGRHMKAYHMLHACLFPHDTSYRSTHWSGNGYASHAGTLEARIARLARQSSLAQSQPLNCPGWGPHLRA
jgi:hypothetical protein